MLFCPSDDWGLAPWPFRLRGRRQLRCAVPPQHVRERCTGTGRSAFCSRRPWVRGCDTTPVPSCAAPSRSLLRWSPQGFTSPGATWQVRDRRPVPAGHLKHGQSPATQPARPRGVTVAAQGAEGPLLRLMGDHRPDGQRYVQRRGGGIDRVVIVVVLNVEARRLVHGFTAESRYNVRSAVGRTSSSSSRLEVITFSPCVPSGGACSPTRRVPPHLVIDLEGTGTSGDGRRCRPGRPEPGTRPGAVISTQPIRPARRHCGRGAEMPQRSCVAVCDLPEWSA